MNTSDRIMQQILTDATPAERAEHQAIQQARAAQVQDTLTALADAQGATVLHLTAAEADTLRFVLGIIDPADFESAADAACFTAIVTKMGA